MQFLDGVLNGVQQVHALLLVRMHQVCDHFRIRLRFKHVTLCGQLRTLLFVVLDDAVVHQRQLTERNVRVSVRFRDAAVGCPTRVTDADVGGQTFLFGSASHFGNATGAAHATDFIGGVDDRDTRRVITTVFQPVQPFDQNRNNITIRDGADNSAHDIYLTKMEPERVSD